MHMTMKGSTWPNWASWHVTELGVWASVLGLVGLFSVWGRISHRQQRLLVLALIATILLLSSNVQAMSMTSYPSHMVEHIIVVLVIAPLVAAATSFRLSRPMSTVGFIAFTCLIPLFHLTALGRWVMQYSGGHVVELVAFFLVGVWFWIPVYGGGESLGDQQRITYAVLALPVIATTGMVLWSATSSSLQSVGMAMSGTTIGDVRSGGLVMMVAGTAVMIIHVGALTLRAATHHRVRRVLVGHKYA